MSVGADRVRHLVELGRWSDARTMLAALLAAEAGDPDLHELDAAVHDGLGDPAGALAAAGRAAALAPQREGPHRAMAYAHHALGDTGAAYRAAREAQRLDPHAWETHTVAAMMATEVGGHADEAAAAAEQALALSPDVASTHFAAGFVAQGQGRRREARRHYRQALALDPDHAEALNNLTMVSGRGRPGRAMRGYAESLRADPHAEVPLANLQVVTIQLLKRMFGLAVLAAVAGTLATGLGTAPVNAGSRAAGAVVAVLVLALLGAYLVGLSRPVRTALWHLLGRMWEFWVVLAATLLALTFGLAMCWVDGVARVVGRHGLLLWLILVLPLRTLLKSRWRRWRAGRGSSVRPG